MISVKYRLRSDVLGSVRWVLYGTKIGRLICRKYDICRDVFGQGLS